MKEDPTVCVPQTEDAAVEMFGRLGYGQQMAVLQAVYPLANTDSLKASVLAYRKRITDKVLDTKQVEFNRVLTALVKLIVEDKKKLVSEALYYQRLSQPHRNIFDTIVNNIPVGDL